MAKNDIRCFRPVELGMAAYPLFVGSTFEEGEPVLVGGPGTLGECLSDPAVVSGISAGTSQGKTATGINGTRPTGTLIQIYKPIDGQLFISKNFATDGAGTPVAPTLIRVGDTAGFVKFGDDWYVDTGASNAHVEITAVLDANGAPLGDQTVRTVGTGVSVVFGFLT